MKMLEQRFNSQCTSKVECKGGESNDKKNNKKV